MACQKEEEREREKRENLGVDFSELALMNKGENSGTVILIAVRDRGKLGRSRPGREGQ